MQTWIASSNYWNPKIKKQLFCLGWVARKFPHIIKKIDSLGYEVATHSDKHQLAHEQSREEFKNDLSLSIKSLEDLLGKKITTYRAPGFSVKSENKWVFEELVNHGIEIDCSIFPSMHSHGGFASFGYTQPAWVEMNGIRIKEFPMSVCKIAGYGLVFSGGGYFRLLPYWMIVQMMKNSDYTMTYFHPRDFDAGQPIIGELSAFRRFKSYYGLGSAFGKLEKLISDFELIDLCTAVDRIDWEKAKIIEI
jgi:polysaccharide deacetylase family protein (PEP-CTERM system associated)